SPLRGCARERHVSRRLSALSRSAFPRGRRGSNDVPYPQEGGGYLRSPSPPPLGVLAVRVRTEPHLWRLGARRATRQEDIPLHVERPRSGRGLGGQAGGAELRGGGHHRRF